ncbi:MAG: PilZ domain-containing protein [Candidatus Electrothrix aestuarii]|uniref:PilZ domain-containing protein n=1 Tax=Candidatus Electrothrix aestuarii TaxID=3062594 RepID=A0AAU8LVC4_9BACT|nr:PilZ domain-containing protein [Candidatus Electrothrix aestuarii]
MEQDRIKVLRAKIDYAETVRDNYKNTPPVLQEVNSCYLDTLNQEIEDLEKSYIADKNQRKYSRVKIQRPVHLKFSSAQYEGILDNISLGGFFVNGVFKQPKSNICKIDLKESARSLKHSIHAVGLIVRIFNSGIAIVFVGMKSKYYRNLKIELLTHATIPSVLRDEIAQQDIFEFDGDFVCNRNFTLNRDKLKKLLDRP